MFNAQKCIKWAWKTLLSWKFYISRKCFRMFNKINTAWFPFEMEHILYSGFHIFKCIEWRKEMNLTDLVPFHPGCWIWKRSRQIAEICIFFSVLMISRVSILELSIQTFKIHWVQLSSFIFRTKELIQALKAMLFKGQYPDLW